MRYPAVAGKFYPLDRDALAAELNWCFSGKQGPGLPGKSSGKRSISAIMAPHAGYRASGMNAAYAYKAVAEDRLPEAYVVIGPDHHGVPFDYVMCGDPYVTPLGECRIHEKIAGRLSELIPNSPNAHMREHSVEVQVPFIQFIDPDARIVPVIMRRQDPVSAERLASAIRRACEGHDVIIVASSDLSHYVPRQEAARLDGIILDDILALNIRSMYGHISDLRISACGYGPVAAAISAARPSSAELLRYSDSWDSLGYDPTAVVGYGSVAFRR
ncbi:MAG: AmmeMemoRadiSam system protein B [Candidatus Methanomethylophilaceae archaeon]|nr:AmmeMemoRadiSam system protein B [Candidatus Methanomethylophilaceae archaeon]